MNQKSVRGGNDDDDDDDADADADADDTIYIQYYCMSDSTLIMGSWL